MDRRRHIPSSESLEGRQLLSAASTALAVGTVPAGVQVDGGAPAQQTIAAKRQHIQNLPYFVGLIHRNNAVPQPTVENIQKDLNSFVAGLHRGNSHDVAAFNLDLRRAQPYLTIRPQDAAALNRDFGAVLINAGAPPAVVADLQAQMTQLANFDSQPGTTPSGSSIAATNDYATILQLALGSGRPLVYPNVPGLLGKDHNGNHGKTPITHNNQPTLTGNYVAGTNIEIVDVNNQSVLGTAAVDKNGVYAVKFASPLPNGTYTVRVRAEESGYRSDPSGKLTFDVVTTPTPGKVKVTSTTPAGPLGSP